MIELNDPDRVFALGHVAAQRRDGVAAVWALDEHLGQIVATTTQPMVGMMRLMWWREAISAGKGGHPVLAALTSAPTRALDPEALTMIVDGWEELLEPLPLTGAQLDVYARKRGAQMFELTAALCGTTGLATPDAGVGAGWALVDFAVRCSDAVTATRAFDLAQDRLSSGEITTLPRPLRILVRLARRDVTARARVARTPWVLLRSVA